MSLHRITAAQGVLYLQALHPRKVTSSPTEFRPHVSTALEHKEQWLSAFQLRRFGNRVQFAGVHPKPVLKEGVRGWGLGFWF